MKYMKIACAVLTVFLVCSAFSLKGIKLRRVREPVYAFGVAASFTDTVVYYTPMQVLDSVKLDKEGFLPNRDLYSVQLKNYVEGDLNQTNYTCMIYFDTNKPKLEKTFSKVKGNYTKGGGVLLTLIEPDAFVFKKPAYGDY
ncbi:MAG: hypothetical protein LUB83_06085 [Prevotellaceae bacterium]|nr:hypothetical protein [Prevotellaceae bacterium]